MPKLFLQSMTDVFTVPGDAMKPGMVYGHRQKMIHSVGNTGKVKFIPRRGSRFTGIFEGANYGIVRLSAAIPPTLTGKALAPGMGLKFLRSGRDSVNLVSMYDVAGQPGDWNFFSHDFTTHIGPSTTTATKALGAKFATATDYIQVSGISDFATYDQNGHKESRPKIPFKLRFAPHSNVNKLFSKKIEKNNAMAFTDQLERVPSGSTLWSVWAWDKPVQLGGHETMIGSLVLDGKLYKSKWGDENLFFRH